MSSELKFATFRTPEPVEPRLAEIQRIDVDAFGIVACVGKDEWTAAGEIVRRDKSPLTPDPHWRRRWKWLASSNFRRWAILLLHYAATFRARFFRGPKTQWSGQNTLTGFLKRFKTPVFPRYTEFPNAGDHVWDTSHGDANLAIFSLSEIAAQWRNNRFLISSRPKLIQ